MKMHPFIHLGGVRDKVKRSGGRKCKEMCLFIIISCYLLPDSCLHTFLLQLVVLGSANNENKSNNFTSSTAYYPSTALESCLHKSH